MANKNPTDILRKEHDIVLNLLDKIEKCIEKKDTKSSEKNIAILDEEFSRHSLNKEEKALFPEIEKFMPREGGPTGMMIMEHEDLVNSIKKFKEAAKNKNIEKLNDTGGHIISLLREHIGKENDILFMMAEMHLDDKQKKLILKRFEEIDSKSK